MNFNEHQKGFTPVGIRVNVEETEPLYHGTKANLKAGDLLKVGYASNDDDPNLTDMRFPGNPTRSYRTRSPLRIVGEVYEWDGHSPEAIKNMLDNIEELRRQGFAAINETADNC
jgi:hypothetical protein